VIRLDSSGGGTELRGGSTEVATMHVAHRIREKLASAFNPKRIEVVDESHQHAGHSGSRSSGETHFRVEIVAAAFEGKTRLERQRMVYAALKEEMAQQIHALSLVTRAPDEPL
jgi:BolA protein